ncbi:MAG TPA: sigma-70 family RNA polymerase sigma factor [Terriglobia bacterium]|nr:sigma-70 family RNA polymerase sigma factor [Terriglobia bacterium]
MAIDSDLELMTRVSRGDTDSFALLLQRHRSSVLSYFVRMVRDRGLAEDLTQEVFLRVYQARERYQPDARFTTWLYRIATNIALNAIRDRKSEKLADAPEPRDGDEGGVLERTPDERPTAEQQMMESDRQRLIREAIDGLPERQKAAVILHKYQEVDYRQIAGVLKVSESAVKSLLFRAYESLRVRLEPLVQGGLV